MPSPMPLYDLRDQLEEPGFAQRLARLKQTVTGGPEQAQTVATIIAEVREHGDEALVRYMRKWTDPAFSAERIAVSAEELDRAERQLSPELRSAIQGAIRNVRDYQKHILPQPPEPTHLGGADLGLRFTPVDSVGLVVPGGSAPLISTVIMLAVPAIVAGVAPQRLALISPPPNRKEDQPAADVHPAVLGAAKLCGLSRVYRIGGAQGIAALALGTPSVQPVDLIVGPGNVYTQLAKAQLSGVVGIDGFYGPSEIVVIADGSAKAERVAADLIAQAEHDPGKCFLVAWEDGVIERVLSDVSAQLPERARKDAVVRALSEESCAVRVSSVEEAAEVTNRLAPEHLSLAVADPEALLGKIRHAGEVFLGDATPVAAGDYWAGPSHTLPTGTTARFTSGISVYSFLKRTGTVAYPQGMPEEAIEAIATLAEAEGLDGHAASVRRRRPV